MSRTLGQENCIPRILRTGEKSYEKSPRDETATCPRKLSACPEANSTRAEKNEFSLARIHFRRLAKQSSSLSRRGVLAMPGVSSRRPGIASLAALGEMRGQLCTAFLHIRKELRGHLLLYRPSASEVSLKTAVPSRR